MKRRLIHKRIHKEGEEEKRYKTKVRAYVIAEEKHKEAVGEYERGDKYYQCL